MSKKEMALALYAELSAAGTLTRQEFLKRAQQPPMSMSAAGASTYFVNCKNAVAGAPVKSYYKPASERKVDTAVDDSKENAPLWSVVVVEGLAKNGRKVTGVVDQAHGFMSESAAISRFNRLNPGNKARCVVVEGCPKEGVDVSTLNLIAID